MNDVNAWFPGGLIMKSKTAKSVGSRPGWIAEQKLDGHRVLVHVNGDVRFYTGGGRNKTGKLPHVEALAANLPAGTWLDGEAIALDGKTGGWGTVQTVLGSSNLHPRHREIDVSIFDILALDGHDMRGLTLAERRDILESVLPAKGPLRVTPRVPCTDAAVQKLIAGGYEGAILKSLGGRYQSGVRSASSLKIKIEETADVVVVGFKPGNGKFAGSVGSVRFGQYKKGRLVERGRCSGMTDAVRDDMYAHPNRWIGQVIEVSFNGHVGGDAYRGAQFKRIRSDKEAADCVWD